MRWGLASVIGLVLAGTIAPATGTVYTWRESDGVDYFTNSLDDVPEAQRSAAKTSVRRSEPATLEELAPAPARRRVLRLTRIEDDSYRHGVERGAKIALEQTRAVGELASSLVESLRRDEAPREVHAPEPRTENRQPGFYVSILPAGRRWPQRIFHGAISAGGEYPGCCCRSSFGYGFGAGRLIPHSHFFPTIDAARRTQLFFPHGHQLDADLFLVGDGYWVD